MMMIILLIWSFAIHIACLWAGDNVEPSVLIRNNLELIHSKDIELDPDETRRLIRTTLNFIMYKTPNVNEFEKEKNELDSMLVFRSLKRNGCQPYEIERLEIRISSLSPEEPNILNYFKKFFQRLIGECLAMFESDIIRFYEDFEYERIQNVIMLRKLVDARLLKRESEISANEHNDKNVMGDADDTGDSNEMSDTKDTTAANSQNHGLKMDDNKQKLLYDRKLRNELTIEAWVDYLIKHKVRIFKKDSKELIHIDGMNLKKEAQELALYKDCDSLHALDLVEWKFNSLLRALDGRMDSFNPQTIEAVLDYRVCAYLTSIGFDWRKTAQLLVERQGKRFIGLKKIVYKTEARLNSVARTGSRFFNKCMAGLSKGHGCEADLAQKDEEGEKEKEDSEDDPEEDYIER